MKYLIIICLLIGISFTSLSQDNPKFQYEKGTHFLTYGLAGSNGLLGATYNRKMTDRFSLEGGIGVITIGAGFKYHLPDTKNQKFGMYIGYTGMMSYSGQWIMYLPVGVTITSKKRLLYNIDFGISYAEGAEGNENYALPWLGFSMGYELKSSEERKQHKLTDPKTWINKQKNSLYLTASLYAELPDFDSYERLIVNYERFLWDGQMNKLKSLRMKLSTGIDNSSEYYIGGQLIWLSGNGSHHKETGLGVTYLTQFGGEIWPTINFGYRYQEQDGHFIYRFGISIPDGLYMSLGMAF